MNSKPRYLFLICPDRELVAFLVKKWNGRRKHFGLFPGAVCEHDNIHIIIAQPLDESQLAYAAVRTLFHNYGKGQFLLLAPAVSLVHQMYPADITLIGRALHFPYPAEFDTHTQEALRLELKSVNSSHSIPESAVSKLLHLTPQPVILTCTAGHSTIPTPTPNLRRRCRTRYQIDILARSAHGFVDAINDQNETGFGVAYITASFHDDSAQEYQRRRLQTFNALAEAVEALVQDG